MQVKIIFDIDEKEYIAFIPSVNSEQGYGLTEKDAILDFLQKCVDNPLYNQKVISNLINKIQ